MIRIGAKCTVATRGIQVKSHVLWLRNARSWLRVWPGSWSGQLSLPLWKRRKMGRSHLGRSPSRESWQLSVRIIAETHAMGEQCGTPVPGLDHLVRTLCGKVVRKVALRCLRDLDTGGMRGNSPSQPAWILHLSKTYKFSQKFHIRIVFSPDAQGFAARFLKLL